VWCRPGGAVSHVCAERSTTTASCFWCGAGLVAQSAMYVLKEVRPPPHVLTVLQDWWRSQPCTRTPGGVGAPCKPPRRGRPPLRPLPALGSRSAWPPRPRDPIDRCCTAGCRSTVPYHTSAWLPRHQCWRGTHASGFIPFQQLHGPD
jgi:hypothetical protein